MKFFFSCFVFIFICNQMVFSQARRKGPAGTIKLGVEHYTHQSPKFEIQNTTTITKESASENLLGPVFLAEYIIKDRFGAGLRYGSLSREQIIDFNGIEVTSKDTVGLMLFDVRTYFSDHVRSGFKPNIGLAFGTYSISSKFSGALADLDEKDSSISVGVLGLNLGADYIINSGGVRLLFSQFSGAGSDTDSIENYKLSYDFAGSSLGISIFLFF